MIEPAIIYLFGQATGSPSGALAALTNGACFPEELPKGIGVVSGAEPDYPAMTYTIIDAPGDYTHEGDTGLRQIRVQFDLYARTATEANAMRAALLHDLSGFRGLVPVSPEVQIYGAFVIDENDSVARDLEQSGPRINRRSIDFWIWARG